MMIDQHDSSKIIHFWDSIWIEKEILPNWARPTQLLLGFLVKRYRIKPFCLISNINAGIEFEFEMLWDETQTDYPVIGN